jgi:hypothetical protein
MPRRSLELLDQTGQVLDRRANPGIQGLIHSVIPIPLFKLFLCYDYPWWEATGVKRGRSVTDLPIRQCYYWGADADSRRAALMIYSDGVNLDFWAGLRDPSDDEFGLEDHAPAEMPPGSAEWDLYRAPSAMVGEAHRQLVEMHGLLSAPEPYAAAFKDWRDDPFGGGYNLWKVHSKSWELIPRIAQPKPPLPVYITGEAYSGFQGWVEGALQTAELVLQDHFHLPRPNWIISES